MFGGCTCPPVPIAEHAPVHVCMSKVETSVFILVLKWVLWSWTGVRAAVCVVSKITVQVCGFEDKGNEFSAEDFVRSLGKKNSVKFLTESRILPPPALLKAAAKLKFKTVTSQVSQ